MLRRYVARISPFQFHKGTIKTVVDDVEFAFELISIP